MLTAKNHELLNFLENELDLPKASIDVALKHWEQDPGPLPIVLWQYGFVTLDQLDLIYDWMDSMVVPS